MSNAFATLSDPTRRELVEALGDGELSVGDLVALVDIQQSGVSRHLRLLREAGFVQVRTEGQRHLYGLRAGPFQELDEWVGRYRKLWEGRFDRLGRAIRLEGPVRGHRARRGD